MIIGDDRFTAQKKRRKIARVILQLIILAGLTAILITALFTIKEYKPYTHQDTTFSSDQGFIALSYFGVDRIGDQTLIGVDRLREHLQTLKKQGYVTITQQDIVEYYKEGKELPEKALFLMFEDGRRDTAIFSEKTLEDLNFKATALTYTEKFALKDTKFLSPKDLQDLKETTFWEMGSNGHRLAFINVFDRYENYLGELTPLKYSMLTQYLGRDYNHYLMDYIRDENRMPKESYLRMKDRISYDYQKLQEIYTKELGAVPPLYVLMHSNTGAYGNDPQVSAVNEYWIKNLFKINFNREGYCLNQHNSGIYDLTRMQPQAYWPTNHLLMRIQYDTKQPLDFVRGDEKRFEKWILVDGAAEFKDESIFLTSLPESRGLLRLKDSEHFQNVKLHVRLRGNRLGQQRIYLRADSAMTRYLSIGIVNNFLVVAEKNGGAEKELLHLDLNEMDKIAPISIPEDQKAAQVRALETFSRYADNAELAKVYLNRLHSKQNETPATVIDGASTYTPAISPHSRGDRQLMAELNDNTLSVYIDGNLAAENLPVSKNSGGVYLEAAWGGYGWSQRNLADDVYDGVFEQLLLTENTEQKDELVLYDARYSGLEYICFELKKAWEALINWFVMYL